MMPVSVPLPNDLTFFDCLANLDGTTYTLQFRWNVRLSCWFLQVRDAEDQNILCGDARIVADFPLYAYLTGRAPPGLLIAVDTSGQGIDPGINDLGQRVQLQYFSESELVS